MKGLVGLLCVLVIGVIAPKGTNAEKATQDSDATAELLARFLATAKPQSAAYEARRTLMASTRGGRMAASLEAWTRVDAAGRFTYEITSQQGSDLIRQKVLVGALEQERRVREEDNGGAELTTANYTFHLDEDRDGDFLRIHLQPRRKSSMLIEGTVFVTHDGLDIVRIEGRLSKRPSFWTRHVEITRHYARVAGVRLPVEMQSRADVRMVGDSEFSMVYDYVSVNGRPVS